MINQDGTAAATDAQASAQAAAGKLPYQRPALTVFGSVRDLTGGVSGASIADGGIDMNRMR